MMITITPQPLLIIYIYICYLPRVEHLSEELLATTYV